MAVLGDGRPEDRRDQVHRVVHRVPAVQGRAEGQRRMRAAVLGSPVSHSLSPTLHRAAYRYLGLDWTYDAIECTVAELPSFVAGLDAGWAGLSLTMPLKAAVLPLLDSADDVVRAAAPATTVVRRA